MPHVVDATTIEINGNVVHLMHALGLAAKGMRVFPIIERQKDPSAIHDNR